MMIIGIGGRAGSGKSTVAGFLAHYGFQEVTFAETLKAGVRLVFGLEEEETDGSFKEVVNPRLGRTPREIMQRFGDACREIYPRVFVDQVRRRIYARPGRVVVSDVRFENEANALKNMGARLVRLERPQFYHEAGIPGHESEQGLELWPHWDAVIVNSLSRELLYRQVGYLLQHWGVEPLKQAS